MQPDPPELARLYERESFQQTTTQDRTTRKPQRQPLPAPPYVPTSPADHTIHLLQELLAIEKERLRLEQLKHDDGVVIYQALYIVRQELVAFDPPVKLVQIVNDDPTYPIIYRLPNGLPGTWAALKAGETQVLGWDTPVIKTLGFRLGTNAFPVFPLGVPIRITALR